MPLSVPGSSQRDVLADLASYVRAGVAEPDIRWPNSAALRAWSAMMSRVIWAARRQCAANCRMSRRSRLPRRLSHPLAEKATWRAVGGSGGQVSSHGDDDLRARVLHFKVPDGLGGFEERIGPVDDGRDLSGLGEFP